ncbi:MAG: MerR family transcriptional regulator [Sphingomonadaceae bacterium]|nr:MerR family transcriptional regulator [Sphingomonadaceae bacterium]
MPKVKDALNGFSAAEVHSISGLSMPMIDYLKRHGFLQPAYCCADNPRGRVRYYSYRDLLVARMLQCFRDTGVQLTRLKSTAQRLSNDGFWADGDSPADGLNWVVSDGSSVGFRNREQLNEHLLGSGQQAFAFVLNVDELLRDIRSRIPREKQALFSMAVRELQFAAPSRAKVA